MKTEKKIQTRIELEKWMKDNCYNFKSYSINGNSIPEGYGIEINHGLYNWYYTERGEKRTLEYFATEKDIVEFAFEKIKNDPYADSNLIGTIKDSTEIEKMKFELKKRNIDFWTNEMNFSSWSDKRTNFFVKGCDIKKVTDLIKTGYNNV